jgi:hypothetical protein
MYAKDLRKEDFSSHFLESFWSRVDKTSENGCWLWTGATNGVEPTGGSYGMVFFYGHEYGRGKRKKMLVHRISYILANGAIPPRLFIDHICHNKLCVNPAHLEAVSNKQNCENLIGASRKNGRGERGVTWDADAGKWRVQVVHNRKHYHGGRYEQLEDARLAAIELRRKLFTHNLDDWDAKALADITGRTALTVEAAQ